MPGFSEDLATLSGELTRIERLLGSLGEADWAAPTLLDPPVPGAPRWTVLQLAGHLGLGMSMLGDPLAGETPAEPENDRIGFFRLPKAEADPRSSSGSPGTSPRTGRPPGCSSTSGARSAVRCATPSGPAPGSSARPSAA